MARRGQRTSDKNSSNFSREKARWRKLRALDRIEARLETDPFADECLAQEADELATRICPDSVVRGFVRENRRG